MKRDKVLVHRIEVTQKGEKQYFQIDIPYTATVVTGIEFGSITRCEPGFQPEPNSGRNCFRSDYYEPRTQAPPHVYSFLDEFEEQHFLGEIKIQGNDGLNIFFEEDIVYRDTQTNYPDYTNHFHAMDPNMVLSEKADQYRVMITGENTSLYCFYKDIWLAFRNLNTTYTVLIYIWYRED